MGDVGVINHTIYVSNLNEKIKKPLLKKSLHRYEIADEMGAGYYCCTAKQTEGVAKRPR